MSYRNVLLLSLLGLLAACAHVQPEGIAINERSACEVEGSQEMAGGKSAATDFCVHTVTAMTPVVPGNNCNPADVGYAVGDSLCMNCKNGTCPRTTTFTTDDGVWNRACQVTTAVSNAACKQIWPNGTCKFYVTLP